MANTNILYNAAYTGALAGISSRWLTTVAESTYSGAIAACQAFATAVDTELGIVANPTQADVNLLQQICSSFWEDRVPSGAEESDYAPFVAPLCALFTDARSEFETVDATYSMPGVFVVATDSSHRNPNVYIYSIGTYDNSDDENAAPLCTWNFDGIGGINCIFQVNPLPDGRILVQGWLPTPSNGGVLIEVPANAPFVDGTPPCRVVLTSTEITGVFNGLAQTQFGEILVGIAVAGPNKAAKLAPELVGLPATVADTAVVYDDGAAAGEPLGSEDFCCDYNTGLVWSSRYGGGGSAALWDFTGAAGTLVPSVKLTGSNWNGTLGVAISPDGELVIGNYDDDRVNFYTLPQVTGNPAPTRTLTTTADDSGVSGVVFDARNNNMIVFYYDTGSWAVFSEAQWQAGGAQTPIKRFLVDGGIEGVTFGKLANGVGVRR